LTGNSVVSALMRYAPFKVVTPPIAQLLVTMHRREVIKTGAVKEVYDAFVTAAREHPHVTFLWPIHPAVSPHLPALRLHANLQLLAPLPHRELILQLSHSIGVLTDSGGLVEEAATLGVPTIILRNHNDRPEAVEAGIARQEAPTAAGVTDGVAALLGGQFARRATTVYGAEDAAEQIAQHLVKLSAAQHEAGAENAAATDYI
jgi:UDP-N-acetylglucosamine 2-epimerase (non-hydrolysing)